MDDLTQAQKVFEKFNSIKSDFDFKTLISGHINRTYLIQNNQKRFILQSLNTSIFKNPEVISQNIQALVLHLKSKNYPHSILTPCSFKNGDLLYDNQWRLFEFIEGTQSFEKVESVEQAFEAAKFLSEFHLYIQDLEKNKINDSIPGFLDFSFRWKQFQDALKSASQERKGNSIKEIEWIESKQSILKDWKTLNSKTPKRIIHADPKISNFLFETHSSTIPKALIDWDTLMLGNILYDFGDMARSYTNLKEEDDAEVGDNFSSEYYKALKEGFLFHLKSELSELEIQNLDLAAEAVIYTQAIRFLTDYLNSDIYYSIHYPEQNLNRTRNQINLLKELIINNKRS